MTIEQIRDIQTPDLVAKVSELKQELFALRFQQGSGQMKQEDSGKIREIKKTIARILTVIKERESKQEGANMERNTRRTLTGVVVSNTNDKTITVVVSTSKKHPLYKSFGSKKGQRIDKGNNGQKPCAVSYEKVRLQSS